MGNCVAGGAYLPVLSDTLLMTEGSQLYLAGPALVKAAIGQTADPEELGGARMHAEISGTVDYREPDDPTCLLRLRSLIELLPAPAPANPDSPSPERDLRDVYSLLPGEQRGEFDVRDVLKCIVDAGSLNEFREDYGRTIVTAYARIGGRVVGLVANQCQRCRSAAGELQIGGVVYTDSAEKAARFVMECNQAAVPIVFFQNVQGFMVGRQSEQAGIIRSGAKLVNVVSNSVVPKLTVVIGGSFGAGNYALCGKAYDPWLILAWPGSRYAVMGGDQAADTLLSLKIRDAEREGKSLTEEQRQQMRDEIRQSYLEQMDIRHGAARGWVDAIIPPHETRKWLASALQLIPPGTTRGELRTGMIQM
jgi:acetyl-CoA carboxylase carboxyltransferase component